MLCVCMCVCVFCYLPLPFGSGGNVSTLKHRPESTLSSCFFLQKIYLFLIYVFDVFVCALLPLWIIRCNGSKVEAQAAMAAEQQRFNLCF